MKKVLCAVTNDLVQDARMKRVCKTLHQAGYDPILIGRVRPESLPFENKEFKWYRMRCFFTKGPMFYAEYNMRLFFRIIRHKPDIIYSADVDTLGACVLGGAICRASIVYDAHEYFSETPELASNPVKKRIWKYMEDYFIPKADLAITVSGALAEIFGKLYGKPFTFIRNVPESLNEFVSLHEERQPGLIYYQGVLNEGRGLEQMIAAMALLPQMHLCIAGEGDLSEHLRKLASDSPASTRIRFVGWQSPSGMYHLAKKAWIGINLLDGSSLSYRYSLANKTFDYIKAGLPALHMDFPEYSDLIRQYHIGWVTQSLQPEMLANTLQRIYDNPASWQEIQQNCVDASDTLTWENESGKLVKVFESL